MNNISNYIETTLDKLGILEGLLEVELKYPNLKVGKNLLVIPAYDNLEKLKVVYNIDDDGDGFYKVYTQVLSLYNFFQDQAILHPEIKNVDKLNKSNKIYVDDLIDLLKKKLNTNIDDIEKEIFSFFSQEIFCSCYDEWKQSYSFLFPRGINSRNMISHKFEEYKYLWNGMIPFPLNCINKVNDDALSIWYEISDMFPVFFSYSRDIIIGIWSRNQIISMDRGSILWGIKILLNRLFQNFRMREFTIEIKYEINHKIPVEQNSIFSLGSQNRSKNQIKKKNDFFGVLGKNWFYPCGRIYIYLYTDSLEIFTSLYPSGQIRKFVLHVLNIWLNNIFSKSLNLSIHIDFKCNYNGKELIKTRLLNKKKYENIQHEISSDNVNIKNKVLSHSKFGYNRLGYSFYLNPIN